MDEMEPGPRERKARAALAPLLEKGPPHLRVTWYEYGDDPNLRQLTVWVASDALVLEWARHARADALVEPQAETTWINDDYADEPTLAERGWRISRHYTARLSRNQWNGPAPLHILHLETRLALPGSG